MDDQWMPSGAGAIMLVSRRTKRMSWRRNKNWIRAQVLSAMLDDPQVRQFVYVAACARAKFLREWFCNRGNRNG